MTIRQFIKNVNNNEQQKVFLIGNTFLLLVILIVLVFRLITSSLDIVLCPLKNLANIPCPLCGGTRCAISFFNLDFVSAFKYHPTTFLLIIYAIFVEIVFIFDILAKKNISKYVFNIDVTIYAYIILTIIQYIVRLYFIFSGNECSFMFLDV